MYVLTEPLISHSKKLEPIKIYLFRTRSVSTFAKFAGSISIAGPKVLLIACIKVAKCEA